MEIERNDEMFADYSIFICAVAVEPTCVVLFLDFPLSPLLFASLALFMVQFKVGHPHSGKLKRKAKLVKKKYWVEVQSSKTSQLLSMHRYFLFSVMFSSFPLISPTKILPWKARAKSSDNWYCQLSCYALKGIVWGLWDSGTPRIQSTRFYQQDRRSVELSQSESPPHFHRTANVQRPLLSLFCQNQTRHSNPACFVLIWAVASEKEWLEIMQHGVTSITWRLSGASGWMLVAERLSCGIFSLPWAIRVSSHAGKMMETLSVARMMNPIFLVLSSGTIKVYWDIKKSFISW